MPPRRKPRPVEIPPLQACPDCGLAVQAVEGGNRHGLAWHDCGWVKALKATTTPTTVEDAIQRLLSIAIARAPEMSGRELGETLEGLSRLQRAADPTSKRGGVTITQEFADWLAPRDGE